MPLEGTVDCAIWLAVGSVLLDTATHGWIPQNSGLVRPIKIVAPAGTLANPIFPAPVIARFCAGIELSNAVVQAFAEAVPHQICGGCGNGGGLILTGQQGNNFWVQVELFSGSYGGRYGSDGLGLGPTCCTPILGTIRSKTSNCMCLCASSVTSCARTPPPPANGAAASVQSGKSHFWRTGPSRWKARVTISAQRLIRRQRRHACGIDMDKGRR